MTAYSRGLLQPVERMSPFDDPDLCRSILESLTTGLCVVDLRKRIVFWSDGAERIAGHLRHDVVGHSCVSERLLHCDQPGREFCNEDCPAAQTMKTSQPVEALVFLRQKAGHEIPVRVRAVPVRNPHGSIIGAVETFEDVQAANLHPRASVSMPHGCVDEVTGVASHAIMVSHLRDALTAFTEMQIPFGLLCFRLEEIDRFHSAFGPEAVSSLLRVVAHTLESALSNTDFVSRWAGDQFLAVLSVCEEQDIHSVRSRLRRMLANDSIEWWGERRSLPVSIGQASAQPGDTIESILARLQKSLDASSPHTHASGAGKHSSSGS